VAVCQVFEHVNTGGVPLTVFELVTAMFAASNFSLRDDWEVRVQGGQTTTGLYCTGFRHDPILRALNNTDFLQAVSLLVTYDRKLNNPAVGVSCKREAILALTLQEYQRWSDQLTIGFMNAAKFLVEQKVFSSRDLPYNSQVVPLAALFVVLGNATHNLQVRKQLARWYWSGVFGELYGAGIEARFARDIVQVVDWINSGQQLPDTITEAYFDPNRLVSMRTRNSAAYKGVHVLLMRQGSRDFISGVPVDVQTYYSDDIDVHHIFPVDYCKQNSIDRDRYDSIINKAPLSSRTNRSIGGHAPSQYLAKIESDHNIVSATLDSLLSTHLIDIASIRSNDFNNFFENRKASLYAEIRMAMQ